MDDFHLLPDQPLKSPEDIKSARFGHKEIADSLLSLINHCPTPFTIGLFGRWGAGKSTISYMLQSGILQNKYGFVLFDVWKHEADALRRTFLKESVNQLNAQKKLPDDFSLAERLESKTTITFDGDFQIKSFFKKNRLLIISIFACFLLTAVLIKQFLGNENFKLFITTFFAILTSGGVLAKILPKIITSSKTIIHELDRFQDPQEFQQELERILLNLKAKKLLIVFDNLDRVTHDKAIQILATINTFLEIKNVKDKGVISLIACDDRAIKEHLKNVYKVLGGDKEVFDEEEFLRKFFNAILRIPDFYPTELESYAQYLLNQTNIQELKESSVAWIVTKAYRNNPRQIIQFINQLIGMYVLVEKRIESNSLPLGFLSGNIAKLAKFLILYNKFPKQMQTLRQERVWSLEQVVNLKKEATDFADLNNFLKETEQIPIDNLNIFLTLRRSEFEVQLPGYNELAIALQDNRIDDAIAYMKALQEFSKKKSALSQAVKKLLDEASLPATKISIINSCLTALNNIHERLEDMAYVDIATELFNLKQFLHIIEPRVIFDQLLKSMPSSRRNDFIQMYVDLIEKAKDKTEPPLKFVKALFVEIIQNQDWFSQHIAVLKTAILEKYYDEPQIIQLLLENEHIQKTFSVGTILSKTFLTLAPTDLESETPFVDKMNLIINTNSEIIDNELVDRVLVKLHEIISFENTKPIDPSRLKIKKMLSDCVTSLFKKHKISFAEKGLQDNKDKLCQIMINAINNIGDWDQKNIYIRPLLAISTISTNLSNQAVQIVKDFIANAPLNGFTELFKDGEEKEWNLLLSDDKYTDIFKQRALKNQDIFDYLYSHLSDGQKHDWLLSLLDSEPLRGINKIELLEKNLPDVVNTLDKLLSRAQKADINIRPKIYQICDKLQFAGNSVLLQRATDYIKEYARSPSEEDRKISYELYQNTISFTDLEKRDIARSIIEWLIALPPDQRYQPYAIRIVLHAWKILAKQKSFQNNFIEFIFRLLESNNTEAVKLGMEALSVMMPPYNNFSTYYIDLKHRTDNEADKNIKDILSRGFTKLKSAVQHATGWKKWLDSLEADAHVEK
jgi:hypothetical protein